jgi:hypothetical protein
MNCLVSLWLISIINHEPTYGLITQIDMEIAEYKKKQFEQKKKNLIKQSSRLIDLSHKIFICPDKPNQQFLNAIMSILSYAGTVT